MDSLRKSKENKYDKYAIKILYEYQKQKYVLGFVPRYYSKQLFELLKGETKYSAKIKGLNLESPLNDENILVHVKLIFEKKEI